MPEELSADIAALDAMVSYQLPNNEAYVPTNIGLVVEFNVSNE
jgi:hypothetical protein